jgi:hypothetical protein
MATTSAIIAVIFAYARLGTSAWVRFTIWANTQLREVPSAKEGVPAVCGGVVLRVLINGFAANRTKPNMNPPSAVPDVTKTGT